MRDLCGRDIHYLRLSVTDKCNLRCRYCMPNGVDKCLHEDILSYEEMIRLVKAMASLGIDTVRITGGEPLVRKDVEQLIREMKSISKISKIYMTTNGVLLADKLDALVAAGLDAVNISLDTLRPERFREITGFDQLSSVLAGIEAALTKGMPVKINCVPQKGVNEDELHAIAELAKNKPVEVRFIEMMPVGFGKETTGIDNQELFAQFKEEFGNMLPVENRVGAGPAVCYQPEGFVGSIGLISAMHGKFCQSCNRVRLTSKGYLKGCLASNQGMDLREMLRNGASDEKLVQKIAETIQNKPTEHHFEHPEAMTEKKGMYTIGG